MAQIKGGLFAKGGGNNGGGGFPTIDLEASQIITNPDTTQSIQFTQDQYDLIMSTLCFKLNFPMNTFSFVFSGFDGGGAGTVLLYNVAPLSNSVITIYKLEITKSTLLASFTALTYPSGKQLYQHNIWFYTESGTNTTRGTLTIINDDDTPLNTISLLATYLNGKGFVDSTHRANYIGFARNKANNLDFEQIGMYAPNTTTIYICAKQVGASTVYHSDTFSASTIVDNVVAL